MRRGLRRKACFLGIGLSLLVVIAGCGGGGTTKTTPPPPAAVTITLGAGPGSLTVGQSFQFAATVANTTNSAVTWSVGGVAGGNATVGTISNSGLYTAPALVPSPASVTITATSQADTTKSASSAVTINISISLNLPSVNLAVTGTQQFSATILGTANTAVTWAVNGIVGGNSTVGTITNGDAGLYTAPAYPPSPNTVTISATSVAYPSISASSTVTLLAPPINVTVNPTALDLQINGTVQFSDMVTTTGTLPISTAVNWGVKSPGSPGVALFGFITANGLYTAPASVPTGALNPIPVYVVSQEDPTKYAIAYVTVTTAPVPLTISTNTLANGVANTPYSATVSAFGGAQPYAWSITAGALPTGLNINAATGVISGTPTVSGTFPITVTVTDQTSPTHETANANLSLTIIPQLAITTSSLPTGSQTAPYNATVGVSGGVGPYTWALISGTLPSGLSLNTSTGAITGTPAVGSGSTTGTTYPLMVKVTDSGTPQQTQTVSLSLIVYIGPVIQTTSPLPTALVSQAYTTNITAVGGASPYTWLYMGLPAWLTPTPSTSLTSTISGTAPASPAAPASFTVKITDANGVSNTATLSIAVATPLSFPPPTVPNGVVGTAYTTTFTASGGITPYTWSIVGTQPPGVNINSSTGVLSGTPTTPGTYSFSIKAVDSSTPGQSATQAVSITIYSVLAITTTSLPTGLVGTAYSSTVAVSGGTGPYSYSIIAGALPGWASLNTTTGAITGATPTAGSSNFTVQVVDSGTLHQTKTQALTLTIYTVLTFPSVTLPGGVVGSGYSTTLSANGGTTPYTWSVVSGSLPSCLSLNASTGAITGSAVAGCLGTANFTIKVSDSSTPSQNATQALSITIVNGLGVTTTSLPAGVVGTAYSQTLAAVGGTTPYTWSISSGALPTCLSLNTSTGAITGSPVVGCLGTASFTVQVTDSTSPTHLMATQPLSITVVNPLSVTTTSLPGGLVATSYNQSLAATGGTTPYTWSISSGVLPTCLSLNASTGAITGPPVIGCVGTANFTVMVTDNTAPTHLTATEPLSITIVNGLGVTTSSLPGGVVGAAYSQTLAAAGGTTPYTWSISLGALPTCLSLNTSTGAITGTPVVGCVGTANFTVMVTDSTLPTHLTATKALSITIVNTLSITTSSLPAGTVSVTYNQSVSAAGGVTPYTWSISAGALPTCLSLNTSTGAITGTPVVGCVGTANFTVMVTDSTLPTHLTATKPLSITITSGVVSLGFNNVFVTDGTVGQAYPGTLGAIGGTPPYSWSISAGALPPCLSLSATTGANITIIGTPVSTCVGSYTFTVHLQDSVPNVVTQQFTININPAGDAVCESGNESVLTGQYAFQLKGFNTSNSFLVYVGSMTLDGSGNIIGGEADGNAPGATPANYNVTGSYTLGADNRGCATINLNGGAVGLITRIVVGSISGGTATAGRIIEFDPTGSDAYIASGPLFQQTTTTVASSGNFPTPSGTYVHLNTGWDDAHSVRVACVGVETYSGGHVSTPDEDCNAGGTVANTTVSGNVGTVTTADAYGRLTDSFNAGAGTNQLAIYINSAETQAVTLTTEAAGGNTVVLAGQATKQASITYNNGAFTGPEVYYSMGISSAPGGDAQFGIESANGTGTVTGTAYENNAGTYETPAAFSCTYSVAVNGRVTVGSACLSIPYLYGANLGYYISTDSKSMGGQVQGQTVPGGGFSASTVNGETFFGGSVEVINQNSETETDIVNFSGGTGQDLAGSSTSDSTATNFQEAGQSGPLSDPGTQPTIDSTTGVISQTKDAVTEAQGVAIDSTHFLIINNKGSSYPSLSTYGPSTADSVVISITSPSSPQSIAVNGTQGITVSVTGTSNTGVTWTLNGLASGAGYGSITGTYPNFTFTAPSSVPVPATYNLVVTSNADVSKTASLQVTITSGGPTITVTLNGSSSSSTSVMRAATLPITAAVSGATASLTLTVNGITNGNSALGTITGSYPSYTYNAPTAIPGNNNPVTIVATQGGTGQTASLTVTINPSTTTPNAIAVTGGNVNGVNLSLTSMTTTLGLSDVGTAITSGETINYSASVTGIQVSRSGAATADCPTAPCTVWLLGQGLTDGTGNLASGLTVEVSHASGSNDVPVTGGSVQGLTPSGGLTQITFQITVSGTAQLGNRDIIVTLGDGETQVYTGAIQIVP